MKRYKFILRATAKNDCKDIWRWRNCPEVRKNFFDSKPVLWEVHKRWFYSKLKDRKTRIYIALQGKNKVGIIRFDIKKEFIAVSVTTNPVFFGKGFGARIIRLGTKKILLELGHARPIFAEIKKDNTISQKAFLRAGYKYTKGNRRKAVHMIGGFREC